MLTHVTVTGADESVQPSELAALSAQYAWVEFGILFSGKMFRSRYPGWDWISCLQACAANVPMALALHLCGQQARNVLGGHSVAKLLDHWLNGFQRVQLNVGQLDLMGAYDPQAFIAGLRDFGSRQLIFQIATRDSIRYLEDAQQAGLDCVPLFDGSGGQGIRPSVWANAVDLRCSPCHGRAGGLGPDTLAEELPRIAQAAGEHDYWIDLESGARTDDRFDLAKVEQVLRLAEPFINKEAV